MHVSAHNGCASPLLGRENAQRACTKIRLPRAAHTRQAWRHLQIGGPRCMGRVVGKKTAHAGPACRRGDQTRQQQLLRLLDAQARDARARKDEGRAQSRTCQPSRTTLDAARKQPRFEALRTKPYTPSGVTPSARREKVFHIRGISRLG
jgi:hypothetical protein